MNLVILKKNHAEDYSSPSSHIEQEADLFSFNKYIERVSSCRKDILENGAWVGVIFSQMILLDRDGMNPEYRKIYGNPWQRISFAIAEIEKNGNFGDDASMYAFLSLSFWLFLKKEVMTDLLMKKYRLKINMICYLNAFMIW